MKVWRCEWLENSQKYVLLEGEMYNDSYGLWVRYETSQYGIPNKKGIELVFQKVGHSHGWYCDPRTAVESQGINREHKLYVKRIEGLNQLILKAESDIRANVSEEGEL